MLHDLTLMELYNATSKNLDENKLYVLNCIMEYLNEAQLFVSVANIDWERIKSTLATWNFYPDDTFAQIELVTKKYTSEIAGEKERLVRQAQGYYDFDMNAINQVIGSFSRNHLTVLDLGCSNGALTISRFADNPKIYKVIGVDYNQADVDEANQLAAAYCNKFRFYKVDLEDGNIIAKLNEIMQENNIEKFDIVFAALVLHHLNNPKLLLLRLYDIFGDDGKIIIRGSDDGGKLCFPQADLLQEILSRYNKIVTTSDRTNGRKLYNQLYNTGYVGIKMFYSIVDTCEKSRKDKENMYRVGFGFRLNTLDRLISLNPNNVHLKEERDWLGHALIELQQAFCERDFWYCNTSYIAIAGVK